MCCILFQYSANRGVEEDEDSDSEEETDDLEPPKVLGDLLESLAGAIFMDSGMDLQAVWTTFEPLFTEKIGMFSMCIKISFSLCMYCTHSVLLFYVILPRLSHPTQCILPAACEH